VDLTGGYFEGGWWYWTPLIRYYKLDLGFDYYYEDLKIKTMENYLREKSTVFKQHVTSVHYVYKAPED
jgi:hypothetical protein